MNVDWTPLKTELAIWRDEGRDLPIWWRDDDAVEDTRALRKLLGFGEMLGLPVHLAIIPKHATAGLVRLCDQHPDVIPVVHGWAHQNHAPEGAKKAEFTARSDALKEAAEGLARLREMFAGPLFEMFVPPWNRIDDAVVAGLSGLGYRALSTYTPRAQREVEGVVQINTHIDPIFWRGGGGLADPEALVAGIVKLLQDRRAGVTDGAEPLGFLSHHLVHDNDIWTFTQSCLSVLLEGGATPCNLLKMKDLP